MAISAPPSVTTGSSTAPKTAISALSDQLDNFLMLLTKQLTNQDPLSPMDTHEFTQQLVSFTGVEQQISANQKLDKIIGLQSGNQTATAVSFLGKEVEILSERVSLVDGSADLTYTLDQATARTSVTLLDSADQPVRVENGKTEAGKHSFHWDGKDQNGADLPDGVYKVRVAAFDRDNKPIKVTVTAIGRVDGVQVKDGEMLLGIGDLQVPYDTVQSVREPKAVAASSQEDEGWF